MDNLFFDPEGPFGLSGDFALNLTSEALGVIVSTVLIAFAFRFISDVLRWSAIRRPRRRSLANSVDDAKIVAQILRDLYAADSKDVCVTLTRRYVSFISHISRRLELQRDLFRFSDLEHVSRVLIAVNSVAATAEEYIPDYDNHTFKAFSVYFGAAASDESTVSAHVWFMAPLYRLNQLCARYGVKPVELPWEMPERFKAYLDD